MCSCVLDAFAIPRNYLLMLLSILLSPLVSLPCFGKINCTALYILQILWFIYQFPALMQPQYVYTLAKKNPRTIYPSKIISTESYVSNCFDLIRIRE
jgi:hypothetical protein